MTRITYYTEADADDPALQPPELPTDPRDERRPPTGVKTQTMQDQLLLVSNPPHGDFDAKQAAPSFGLAAAEVRMKANYQVPEIWVADRDQQRIETTAADMRNAGLKVVLLNGERLLLPVGMSVRSFAFDEHGLTAAVGESEMEVGEDTPIVAVFCKPKASVSDGAGSGRGQSAVSMTSRGSKTRDSLLGGSRRSSSMDDASNTPDHPAFVDVYVPSDGQVMRLTFQQGTVDFGGLGSPAPLNPIQGLTMLMDALETRFAKGRFDRRLVNMIPRRRTLVQSGVDYSVARKGYSFASEGLAKLLGGIAPGLDELGQMELSSRLAYLTVRDGQTALSHAS